MLTQEPMPTFARRRPKGCSPTSQACCRQAESDHRLASRRWGRVSETRSLLKTGFSALVNSSKWNSSSLCHLQMARRGTSTGASTASSGIETWASPTRCCAFAPTTMTSSRTTQPEPRTLSSCSLGAGTNSKVLRNAPITTSLSTPNIPVSVLTISTKQRMSATCRMSSSLPLAQPERWQHSFSPHMTKKK